MMNKIHDNFVNYCHDDKLKIFHKITNSSMFDKFASPKLCRPKNKIE